MLPAQERHQRKCAVCRHPDREEIEEEFIHWRDVCYLAQDYNIQDYRSIYRHARVFGLIERRRENRRYMLDRILENFPNNANAHAVIQAIRAYSCLTDDNRWVEPPTRVEYAITTNRPQNPAPELESASPRRESPALLDVAPSPDSEPVPTNSGPLRANPALVSTNPAPAAADRPNSPPTWPNWNGRFARTGEAHGPGGRAGL